MSRKGKGKKEKKRKMAGQWHAPLMPALRGMRQVDLFEFKTSMVYRMSSRVARATQRNPVFKSNRKKRRKKKNLTVHH